MSRLTDLLRQVERIDKRLADDLAHEVRRLGQRREFGLNFERHTPEAVELPGRPVRVGDKVRVQPPRGDASAPFDRGVWYVAALATTTKSGRVASLVRPIIPGQEAAETMECAVEDLVVLAEFRDPIYPGLVSTGKVQRGGDKPFHTVVNAENFHALEALLFTHEGKVDAIYIDPPYNTGAKDWKYNNDYVDSEDAYRHSKWLAFMERRLKLAKRLLNPENSLLIVTIDEKEYLRLGLLLQQTFPEAILQMVTIVNNPKGVTRATLSRVEEYAFFCFFGSAMAASAPDDLLTPGAERTSVSEIARPRWKGLLRSGSNAQREQHPTFFYPILIEPDSRRIVGAGESPPIGVDPDPAAPVRGYTAIWPVRSDGTWGRWMLKPATLLDWAAKGYVAVGEHDPKRSTWGVNYLTSEPQRQIESGVLTIRGHDAATGVADVVYAKGAMSRRPRTVWNRTAHDAGVGGTATLGALLPRRAFSFAKSLYAVEDAVRIAVADKPEAVVLDFFAGSGTTAHAVMRLNRQDGGRRQCISVTNNEVSADEQAALRKRGLRPGDPEWEKHGICDYITKPRIRAAIEGRTPDGEPIKGDYRFTDEFPMADGFEENAEFFTLTYEEPRAVRHGRAFERIAPLLWLRAGARGSRIDKPADDFALAETYAVLFDLDFTRGFVEALASADGVRTAFIITEDERGYQTVCAELPERVTPVRLYDAYLTNATLNAARD